MSSFAAPPRQLRTQFQVRPVPQKEQEEVEECGKLLETLGLGALAASNAAAGAAAPQRGAVLAPKASQLPSANLPPAARSDASAPSAGSDALSSALGEYDAGALSAAPAGSAALDAAMAVGAEGTTAPVGPQMSQKRREVKEFLETNRILATTALDGSALRRSESVVSLWRFKDIFETYIRTSEPMMAFLQKTGMYDDVLYDFVFKNYIEDTWTCVQQDLIRYQGVMIDKNDMDTWGVRVQEDWEQNLKTLLQTFVDVHPPPLDDETLRKNFRSESADEVVARLDPAVQATLKKFAEGALGVIMGDGWMLGSGTLVVQNALDALWKNVPREWGNPDNVQRKGLKLSDVYETYFWKTRGWSARGLPWRKHAPHWSTRFREKDEADKYSITYNTPPEYVE